MVGNIARIQSAFNFTVPYCVYKYIYIFFSCEWNSAAVATRDYGAADLTIWIYPIHEVVIEIYFEPRRQTEVNVEQSRQLAQGDMRAALLLLT